MHLSDLKLPVVGIGATLNLRKLPIITTMRRSSAGEVRPGLAAVRIIACDDARARWRDAPRCPVAA